MRLRDVVKLLVSFIVLDLSLSNISHISPTNPYTLAPPYPSGGQYFFPDFVLEIQNFQGGNSVHLTHVLWWFLLCHVERAVSSRSAQEWNACTSMWQHQQGLCKTALNLLTWAYLHSFLVEPHISPSDLFDIFLVSLLQEHFNSEVPYSAEQTWHLIKLTYLVCIYTCRL